MLATVAGPNSEVTMALAKREHLRPDVRASWVCEAFAATAPGGGLDTIARTAVDFGETFAAYVVISTKRTAS